jgi:hypothetical protein
MLSHCRASPEEVKRWCVESSALAPENRQFLNDFWDTPLVVKLLDDWHEAADCEKIWIELESKLQPCQPADLLLLVILQRHLAKEIDLRLHGGPKLDRQSLAYEKRHLRSRDPARIRERALVLMLRASRLEARQSFSREAATAARQRFVANLNRAFAERCNGTFNWAWAIAALTAIAFDCDYSADDVRSALKPRGREARRKTGTRPPK